MNHFSAVSPGELKKKSIKTTNRQSFPCQQLLLQGESLSVYLDVFTLLQEIIQLKLFQTIHHLICFR